MHQTHLYNRALISLNGHDRLAFLQGIITNDAQKILNGQLLYTLLLTPNGRFLHDLFIFQYHDIWFIDCEKDRRNDLIKHLQRYKLRSNIMLESLDDWCVYVSLENKNENLQFDDPRHPELGMRIYTKENRSTNSNSYYQTYETMRITLGIPDGSRDMPIEKAIPLECNMKELSAIDWQKGCYMGQEFTARTNYLGQIRKRLLPIHSENNSFQTGDVLFQNNEEVGNIRTVCGNYGLALLRLNVLENNSKPIICNNNQVKCLTPNWLLPLIQNNIKN